MPDTLLQLIATERPALLAYVRGMVRDAALAEDLTQEALLRAHQGLASLRDQERLLPWLYRIATNLCRDQFRRQRTARDKLATETVLPSAREPRDENAPQFNKVMECAEMGDCVQRYFRTLPDSFRAVILLHDVEGMTCQEIAELLDVSVDATKIRLHRARKQLRAILEDVCHFYLDERGVLVCEPKHSVDLRQG